MLHFYSTQGQCPPATLEEAVMNGLAPDGGLYMPERIPRLPDSFIKQLPALSFHELSYEIAKTLLGESLTENTLLEIIKKSSHFDAPLKKISPGIHSLELFHGPTLSFKDFGAQFMAQLMGYFMQKKDNPLHILVATSGDTGSAIAQAFLDVPSIKVWILYPQGKVSWTQELQLTTMGKNITALEVQGTFDDCQRLVKTAFSDQDLRSKRSLTSANSINIARLIPQSFYYFRGFAQLEDPYLPTVFSVPSGNFGNLAAGIIAQRMGLPIHHFIAATNINDSVPSYLKSGIFTPKPSKHTISNAMDVGNPSNFARLLDLYGNDWTKIRHALFGVSYTDIETENAIHQVFTHNHYILDPHGAVAYLGLQSYLKSKAENINGIFLETAHPAKFAADVEKCIHQKIDIPPNLQETLLKTKYATLIGTDYSELKSLLEGCE
ncbi:MAG: threonine synthase [Parachlamydiales bacterium]|jgi:threonine synthase